jgi:FRG domain-containing protein
MWWWSGRGIGKISTGRRWGQPRDARPRCSFSPKARTRRSLDGRHFGARIEGNSDPARMTSGGNEPLEQIDGPSLEYRAATAEEFWEVLSPQKRLFGPCNRPIFRGQANDAWGLEPSILRKENHPVYSFRSSADVSENRIVAEIHALHIFASYCDSSGLRIPHDSKGFREKFLDPTKVMDGFIFHRRIWPSNEYFEIMALGQHYGLHTRLLDWSRRSHVAAYFAASGALNDDKHAASTNRLVVWALNTENIKLNLTNVEVIPVPGSNNANLAAQGGLFTLLRQEYTLGKPFVGPHCLVGHARSCGSRDLAKVTLPVAEAPKVIDLCERHGVTAATLYPDFYGAAKATRDSLACWARSEWTDGRDIRAQTVPI